MPHLSTLTRRQFIKLAGLTGLGASLASAVRVFTVDSVIIRPPGARPEMELLSRCLKCQKCEQVCPQNVIASVLITESLLGAGTPKLNFDLGYCDCCGACADVCPTNVIEPFEKNSIHLGVAQIDKTKCVAWEWGGCIKCYQECPIKAITLDEKQRPVVDETHCDGCGKCQFICPAPSLRSYSHGGGKGIVIIPYNLA